MTTVRLATSAAGGGSAIRTATALTDVRLAWGGPAEALAGGLGSVTDVRLARANQNTRGVTALTDVRLVPESGGRKGRDDGMTGLAISPALLVSYAYWKQFARERPRYTFRDYSLDSGAFTAKKSGVPVDLQVYTEFCRQRLSEDPQCVEVFALDVIGDWEASLKNAEAMWVAGVPAIPTYHYGSPEAALLEIARSYPKIALGGAVGLHAKEKRRWVEACFSRVWPKRVHGFGMMARELLFAVPFDSVDASNWEQAPAAFGNYKSMGKPHRSPRGRNISLRAEVEWYLKLERELKQRWGGELAKLQPREAVAT